MSCSRVGVRYLLRVCVAWWRLHALCAGLARALIRCSGGPAYLLRFVDSGGSCSFNMRRVFSLRGACPSSTRVRPMSH